MNNEENEFFFHFHVLFLYFKYILIKKEKEINSHLHTPHTLTNRSQNFGHSNIPLIKTSLL